MIYFASPYQTMYIDISKQILFLVYDSATVAATRGGDKLHLYFFPMPPSKEDPISTLK
jgi:hypothetical protein